MRKLWFWGLPFLLAGCALMPPKPEVTPVQPGEEVPAAAISVVIDDGESVATYSGLLSEQATALSVIQALADAGSITLSTKVYDFGTLVEAINGNENTAERAWIYFVNGQSGDVGADQKQVGVGDTVEWKYIEPIF
jgi:hypothetical protein